MKERKNAADQSQYLLSTVDTTLDTVPKSWLAVDSTKKDITIPGAYSLVEVTEGGIAVAKADNYDVVPLGIIFLAISSVSIS